MSIAGFHRDEYINLITKLLKKDLFSDFHKLYRQVDMHKNPKIDVFIYDILDNELYLPYNKREKNISNSERAELFVEWIILCCDYQVIKCIVKGLDWMKVDMEKKEK